MTTTPAALPRPIGTRRDGDPVADLTTYYVMHRAMRTDVRRLAELAAGCAAGTVSIDPRRGAAFRRYSSAVDDEIHMHHRKEDTVMGPVIAAPAGDVVDFAPLPDEHRVLDPLRDRARALAATL